jgi:hypothetical protein
MVPRVADRTWSEIRPLLAEHGVLQGDVDGPVVFDDGLIQLVRHRLEAMASPPVSPDEAERVMRGVLKAAQSMGPPPGFFDP